MNYEEKNFVSFIKLLQVLESNFRFLSLINQTFQEITLAFAI